MNFDYTKKLLNLVKYNKVKCHLNLKNRRLKYSFDKYFNKYYDCYFESNEKLKNELEFQLIIEKYTGYKTYLVPKTKIQGVKTPDFWIKELNELWDLKCVYGCGKNRINNIFYKSKTQTNNLILKIKNDKINIKTIKKDIYNIFIYNRHIDIKKVILIDYNSNIVLYYKR